jgi:hypothetical protein
MTPNIGQGGNAAIETAAALANSLKRLLSNHGSSNVSFEDIKTNLQAYQRKREARIKAILTTANKQTRIDSFRGPVEKFIALSIAPRLGKDFIVNLQSESQIGAERLEYLRVPQRSLNIGMPYNQSQGVGQHESLKRRAMTALPILAFGYFCQGFMDAATYHHEVLQTMQKTSFIVNLAPIYLIWLTESKRHANFLTLARL